MSVPQWELAELVARVGCLYVKLGQCPPPCLRDAAKHRLGLTHAEILEVIEVHFDHHRRLYTAGSGDAYFGLVEAAMRKAWQEKHPNSIRRGDDPGTARRKRTGGDGKTYQAAGYVATIATTARTTTHD